MTRDEIKNTPEIVDFMLDESITADSRMKLHKRLEELCKLAIKALDKEPCKDCISREAVYYYISSHINEIITESGTDKNAHTNAILRSLANGVKTMPSVLPKVTKNDLGVDWDELKRKILMEIDGGTDDAWLAYGEVCDRISNSIDEFVADMREVKA